MRKKLHKVDFWFLLPIVERLSYNPESSAVGLPHTQASHFKVQKITPHTSPMKNVFISACLLSVACLPIAQGEELLLINDSPDPLPLSDFIPEGQTITDTTILVLDRGGFVAGNSESSLPQLAGLSIGEFGNRGASLWFGGMTIEVKGNVTVGGEGRGGLEIQAGAYLTWGEQLAVRGQGPDRRSALSVVHEKQQQVTGKSMVLSEALLKVVLWSTKNLNRFVNSGAPVIELSDSLEIEPGVTVEIALADHIDNDPANKFLPPGEYVIVSAKTYKGEVPELVVNGFDTTQQGPLSLERRDGNLVLLVK